jgi:hypothetical protein
LVRVSLARPRRHYVRCSTFPLSSLHQAPFANAGELREIA